MFKWAVYSMTRGGVVYGKPSNSVQLFYIYNAVCEIFERFQRRNPRQG